MADFGFWFDGQLVSGDRIQLAIADPALLYGATAFTTLRVYGSLDHPLTQWIAHCERLRHTLQAFGWTLPDWLRTRTGAEQMAIAYPVLRITIFPDGREWITGRSLPPDLEQRQQDGIAAWVIQSDVARSLPQHKTGNYLAPWLALQIARTHHSQEAILVDAQGNWLETSTGTLWGWHDGRWYTPPATGILPGLVRSRLISKFKCQNEEVVEQPWTPDLVQRLTAIAYTNCVVEAIPIHTVLARTGTRCFEHPHPALDQLRRGLSHTPDPDSLSESVNIS
jgi:4-amino-4-deoxychorismate lyase